MSKVQLPVTRYSGSKRKLVVTIWEYLEFLGLDFHSVLDVFGGSGIFSYYSKLNGKSVVYNDIFKFNHFIGKAIIQNNSYRLSDDEVLCLLEANQSKQYDNVIERNFSDIYFTDAENRQIDIVVQNIQDLPDEGLQASAYYILFQSCIIKRPYNLFHRKNLHMRVNYTNGNFGNKVTWERPFSELFLRFSDELRKFTFDNGQENTSMNTSALNCNISAELVYVDPPYFVKDRADNISYHKKYHFLEGLAHYDDIQNSIDFSKKNREIHINNTSEFEDRDLFLHDLESLITRHSTAIIVISYRNNGIPSIEEIRNLLSLYRKNVYCINIGNHGYALNRSNESNCEYLFVGF